MTSSPTATTASTSTSTSTTTTEPSESPEDKAQAEWVENIRVIEGLRRYVQERLVRGQFDLVDGEKGGRTEGGVGVKVGVEEGGLYPVLRGVE